MLMEALIVEEVPGSNGYKWKIVIPELFGVPENINEKLLFDQYAESQRVSTTSDDVKNDLASMFLRKFKKTQQTASVTVTDDQKRFYVEARVVGVPNSKIKYSAGDVVIVGFQNNDMMKPLILGYELNPNTLTESKMSINLDTLSVETKSVLPVTATTYKVPDNREILDVARTSSYTAEDVAKMLKFYHEFENAGLSISLLTNMISVVESFANTLPKGDS